MKRAGLMVALFAGLFAQKMFAQDASHLRISILTCGQGDELYTIFGHTAIRITDSAKQTDIVYNYGNFDYNDPDFYTKFVRGKLDYSLAIETLPDFMYEYQVEKRSVTEQQLFLTAAQKQNIQNALTQNLIGSARYYKYDFTLDNCTTRVRDMLIRYAALSVSKELVPPKTTFRNMLHEYLNNARVPWTKLGIDLLMGSSTDKKVHVKESMFLPDYLMKGIDSSGNGIMQEKTLLNNGTAIQTAYTNWPLFVFSGLSVSIVFISFLQKKIARRILLYTDVFLFLSTGLLGLLFIFLWFGTDHPQFADNYNLLWALPTNIIAAFSLRKNPRWLQKYFTVTSFIYACILLCWSWLPQQFNIALVPLVMLLLFRSLQLRKK